MDDAIAEREHHMGKNLWITRKGAIRAREGDRGVIPGSMGAASFIVSGLGHPGSFTSASHGAGRRMSRGQARKTIDPAEFAEQMGGRTWLEDRAERLLDEAPDVRQGMSQVNRVQKKSSIERQPVRNNVA